MEINFIKIENSFNKKDIPIEKTEMLSVSSTKGQETNNPIIINSQTMVSSTSNQLQNGNSTKILPVKKPLMQEIFVGTVSAASGSIITYFIINLFKL